VSRDETLRLGSFIEGDFGPELGAGTRSESRRTWNATYPISLKWPPRRHEGAPKIAIYDR
jgi:hypothetical protein